MKLIHADCLEAMKKMPDNSVDSVVTDPPYGLEFMGKDWDSFSEGGGVGWKAGQLSDTQELPEGNVFKDKGFAKLPIYRGMTNKQRQTFYQFCVEWAKECLRVLKPGGHLLSFGGSRTYHRMACAIEDAGFEIRDQIMWVYGSGFPKSLNISKAIDAKTITGKSSYSAMADVEDSKGVHVEDKKDDSFIAYGDEGSRQGKLRHGSRRKASEPITDEAKEWDGWGTALKPAHEPIVVARKPLIGTVAANVLEHGTGGLNIDGCRVGDTVETWPSSRSYPLRTKHNSGDSYGSSNAKTEKTQEAPAGRFPANFIHDGSDEIVSLFPEEKARFFYCAKPSKAERNAGLEAFEDKKSHHNSGGIGRKVSVEKRLEEGKENAPMMKNIHPTVKPTALMRYLCRLVTPPNGVVLDPFMGSGTTGVGAVAEGFDFIGIEMDQEYINIAEARIKHSRQEHKTDYVWL